MDREHEELSIALLQEIRRVRRLNITCILQECFEGEAAALSYLYRSGGGPVTPSMISAEMGVTRTRIANILHSLREKGFVRMDIAAEDRRKMEVYLLDPGKEYWLEKSGLAMRYITAYIDLFWNEDTKDLIRLLKKASDNEILLEE